jgi:hypothetical protein
VILILKPFFMKCLNVSDLQLYFCLKKLSTETELLFIGCFPRLLLTGKIDFLKHLRISIFWLKVVGCVFPPPIKLGYIPPGLTPLLMIVERFHEGNAHGGRPTVIKVRK